MVICMLVSMPFAMAEDKDTGPADWNKDLGWGNDLREYMNGHDHPYEQYSPKPEIGVKAELVVYENEDRGWIPDEVRLDPFIDINNTIASKKFVGGGYITVRYNLWDRLFGSGE